MNQESDMNATQSYSKSPEVYHIVTKITECSDNLSKIRKLFEVEQKYCSTTITGYKKRRSKIEVA